MGGEQLVTAAGGVRAFRVFPMNSRLDSGPSSDKVPVVGHLCTHPDILPVSAPTTREVPCNQGHGGPWRGDVTLALRGLTWVWR